MIAPILEDLATEMSDKLVIGKYNVTLRYQDEVHTQAIEVPLSTVVLLGPSGEVALGPLQGEPGERAPAFDGEGGHVLTS